MVSLLVATTRSQSPSDHVNESVMMAWQTPWNGSPLRWWKSTPVLFRRYERCQSEGTSCIETEGSHGPGSKCRAIRECDVLSVKPWEVILGGTSPSRWLGRWWRYRDIVPYGSPSSRSLLVRHSCCRFCLHP